MAKAQPITIGEMHFRKKGDALVHLKEMLNKYNLEEQVSEELDDTFLRNALTRHPKAQEKIGVGVKHFFVRRSDHGTRCFWVRRYDDSVISFSYKNCV